MTADPVVVLSYAYSGASRVQDILAAGHELACTSGTGIIPLCAAAAQAWRRVEDRDEQVMSRLALSTTRGLVGTQMTAILASTGQARWCELTTAAPSATEPFLQVFPQVAVVCVHRRCPEVIQAVVQANPWGLSGPGLAPYLLAYAGNSVAAIAAYWASCTEELLAFEQAHPQHARRARYEDMIPEAGAELATLRAWLTLTGSPLDGLPQPRFPSDDPQPPPAGQVPLELIPGPLRQRIDRLNAALGYLALPWPGDSG
jgi:hypothetical protein